METTMVPAITLGLLAAMGWGIADFIGAKASRKLGPIMSAGLVNAIGTAAYTLVFVLFFRDSYQMTAEAFWFASGAGAIISFGAIAFYKALQAGPVSIVTPLSAAYPLVTTLLAVLLFGAKLTARQIIGVAAIVAGVMLASKLLTKSHVRGIGKGPLYALLCALCWGVGYALVAQATKQIGWQSATLVEFIAIVATFAAGAPLIRKYEQFSLSAIGAIASHRIVIGVALVQVAAALAFNIGLSVDTTSGALVSALSACFPVLTIILALKHFDESFELVPLVGAGLSICGVVVMSIS